MKVGLEKRYIVRVGKIEGKKFIIYMIINEIK